MIEFNFKIAYKFEIQNIKFDNLIRRSQNFSKKHDNKKHQYNYRTLLKTHHLKSKIKKIIAIIFALINENKKNRNFINRYDIRIERKKTLCKRKIIKKIVRIKIS